MSNAKFYFYDNFLIVKSEDSIERIPYNKILFIKEGKTNFYFAIKSRSFIIEKSKIDDKFYKFLKDLSKQYKSIQISSDDNLFWDCLHKHMSKYNVYCINDKNEETLEQYFNTKKSHRNLFIFYLCIGFILIHILIFLIHYIFDIFFTSKFKFSDFLFYSFIIVISTILNMQRYIKYEIKRLLESNLEKLYFYDDFLLIKTEEKIFKCNYDNIRSVIENEDLLFIKVKSILSPIIINKQSFRLKDYNLFDKIIIH